MNCKLPIVTIMTIVCSLVSVIWASERSPTSGQRLVKQASENLARHPALQAKIRQTMVLFGQYLVGSGSYRQLIIGEEKMFRLELRLQVGETTTSLLQVCDGTHLWEKRDLGATQEYGQLTVRHFRDAVDARGGDPSNLSWMALGGIDQLLQGLHENFEFGEATASEVGERGLPVWKIKGRWKPRQPRRPSSSEGEDTKPLDDWAPMSDLPQSVVVTLGRDQALPLFPYVIEYLDESPSGHTAGKPASANGRIATIQLYEVQRYANIDSRDFAFQIDEQEEVRVLDLSPRYLERLGLKLD